MGLSNETILAFLEKNTYRWPIELRPVAHIKIGPLMWKVMGNLTDAYMKIWNECLFGIMKWKIVNRQTEKGWIQDLGILNETPPTMRNTRSESLERERERGEIKVKMLTRLHLCRWGAYGFFSGFGCEGEK